MWFLGFLWECVVLRIWDVSGLTSYDRATLSASFYYHWDERLNCSRALSQLGNRSQGVEQAEETIRARFGCNTISKESRITIDGIGYHSCLCNFKHPLFYTYLDLLTKLDGGILPDRGPYLDQSAQLVETLQFISRLRNEANAAEQAKQSKAANNGR